MLDDAADGTRRLSIRSHCHLETDPPRGAAMALDDDQQNDRDIFA
uniref:Uncharacterized protein n=1 Tax=Candidatus Kentrum sp. LFY TaxID=2126342 RepID=A0A450UN97_9GAMM|nr:MAG: hypothetical protein BECKLFY1418A_GA0070994_103619 [Candidatus Kentron sp. LFY]